MRREAYPGPRDGPIAGPAPQMPCHVDFPIDPAEGVECRPNVTAEQPGKIGLSQGDDASRRALSAAVRRPAVEADGPPASR